MSRDDFSLEWEYFRIQRSMNDVPRSTSTARLSTTTNQASIRRCEGRGAPLPRRIRLRDFRYANVVIQSTSSTFSMRAEKVRIPKLGAVPVSIKLVTVAMALAEILTVNWTQYVALRTKDAMLYGLSFHCTLMTYGPYGCSVRSCSFDDESILSALSTFVCFSVMLPPCVEVSVVESLCVTSDGTSESGLCFGARLLVVGPLHLVFQSGAVLDASAKSRFSGGLF